MKENMTTNNKPALEIFVVREGSNKKSYFTKIGAAWPTKSGSGYNADLSPYLRFVIAFGTADSSGVTIPTAQA